MKLHTSTPGPSMVTGIWLPNHCSLLLNVGSGSELYLSCEPEASATLHPFQRILSATWCPACPLPPPALASGIRRMCPAKQTAKASGGESHEGAAVWGVCSPAQQSLRNQPATGSGKAIPVTSPQARPCFFVLHSRRVVPRRMIVFPKGSGW